MLNYRNQNKLCCIISKTHYNIDVSKTISSLDLCLLSKHSFDFFVSFAKGIIEAHKDET